MPLTSTVEMGLNARQHNFNFIRLCTSIMVIYSHAFDLTGVVRDPLFVIQSNPFYIQGIGINVFFVISGFLISASFDRSKSVSQFFFSRAIRIYPALIAVILISALVMGPLITTHSLTSYFSNVEVYKYLTNIAAIRIQHSLPGVFENNHFPDFVNGSLWTLPLVVLSYALLAMFGSLLRRKINMAIAIAIAIALLIYFHPEFYEKPRYYVNLSYFLMGAIFYLARKKIVLDYRAAISFALIFITAKTFLEDYPLPFIFTSAISSAYVVLFLAFAKNNYLHKITSYGDFTYGMYIWAFPVQQLLVQEFPQWNPYQNFIVALVASLGLAILSWHLIEKRFAGMKRTSTPKQILKPLVPQFILEERRKRKRSIAEHV